MGPQNLFYLLCDINEQIFFSRRNSNMLGIPVFDYAAHITVTIH